MRRLLLLLLPLALLAQPASARGLRLEGVWPTGESVQVVRRFDPPARPWLPGHRGVDLLVGEGQPVRSPIGGVVAVAAVIVDRPVIVVRSGSIRVSLEPVRAAVEAGATVDAGDVLGYVAASAGHCPPRLCLHWGLRVDGVYHDPLLLVARYRPVLLPSVG